jgi:hypothetical protein
MTLVNRQLLKNFSQLREGTKNSIHELRILSASSQKDSHQNTRDMFHLYEVYDELFYSLQEILTGDHKSQVFSQLKSKINSSMALQIGINILQSQTIEKPVLASNIIPSITPAYWETIFQIVYSTEQFRHLKLKVKKFYKNRLDTEIDAILGALPLKVDLHIQEEYRKQYYKHSLSFDDFLDLTIPSRMKLGEDDPFNSHQSTPPVSQAEQLRENFEKALEKKKLDQEKKSQAESFDNYKEYFQMDERDLKRIKRNSKKRRPTKKTRRGKYQK